MLSITDLSVEYARVPAVREVSLAVAEGETVGLVGSNGAGKSTTLLAVMGLVRSAAGSIAVDGEPLDGLEVERRAERGVSLVPEGRRVLGSLTVGENLRLGSTVRGGSDDDDAVAADLEAVLERFPVLRQRWNEKAGLLSGGQQQQLVIARAMMARPRLMLLDEPTLGLAPMMVDEIFEILAELRRDGVTVLVAEQNAVRTVELADRVYVMRTGRIVHQGTREEIAASTDLAEHYLGL